MRITQKQCEKLLAHFGYEYEYHFLTGKHPHVIRFRHHDDEDEPPEEWISECGATKLEAYNGAVELGYEWYTSDWLCDTDGENYDFDVVPWGNSLRILKNKPCLIKRRS